MKRFKEPSNKTDIQKGVKNLASAICWGVLWKTKGGIDGDRQWILRKWVKGKRYGIPVLFSTRHEARAWVSEHYGYIKTRKDLRKFPHGWRLPIPVRLNISLKDDRKSIV